MVILKLIPYLIVAVWFFHFFLGLSNLNVQLQGTGEERFIDGYTAFALANVTMWLLPFAFDRTTTVKSHRIIILFSLVMILFAQSRSVWVATVVGLIVFLFFGSKTSGFKKNMFSFVVMALMLGISLIIINKVSHEELINNFVANRMAFVQGADNDPNGSWRVAQWLQIINNVTRNNLLWGFGFTEMRWVVMNTQLNVWEHNQYVHIFRVMGLIGIIVYIVFFIACINYVRKTFSQIKDDVYRRLIIGLASALIMNIIFMLFYNQHIFLWINIAMVLIIVRLDLIERNQQINYQNH